MYKMITFDMYSATLDIFGSSVPLVKKVLRESDEKCDEFFRTWRAQQWNYLLLSGNMQDGFLSYTYLTKKALDYTEFKLGYSLTSDQKDGLFEVWKNFSAWPEAKEVLDELKKRGYLVAMLSNGDVDMLSPLQQSTGIDFDYIFAADMAKCHKPTPNIYYLPLVELGIGRNEFLHVAGSSFDVMGAKSAGLHCAWSNRFRDRTLDAKFEPNFNMKNLYDLLDILPNK